MSAASTTTTTTTTGKPQNEKKDRPPATTADSSTAIINLDNTHYTQAAAKSSLDNSPKTSKTDRQSSSSSANAPRRPIKSSMSTSSAKSSDAHQQRKLSASEEHGKPQRRKLSESRGVMNLPDLRLTRENSNLSTVPSDPNSSADVIIGAGGDALKYNSSDDGGLNERTILDTPLTRIQNAMSVQTPGGSGERLMKSVLDICIFLPDRRGLKFSVNGGRMANVATLQPMVWDHLNLDPAVALECFGLWMISPLFEIQLKPHHMPFQIALHWTELLRKFTTAGDKNNVSKVVADLDADEPIICFRRNVLLSKHRQRKLSKSTPKIAELLFLDARESVLTGKYLCDMSDAFRLAAIDMALTWGPYNSLKHTPSFIRDSLDDFLPEHYLRAASSFTLFGWSLPGCKGQENAILHTYRTLSTTKAPEDLQREYLNMVMKLPFYGAAFFNGQMERPPTYRANKLIKSFHEDLPVQISVSREYITIADATKHVVLLAESVLDCKWQASALDCQAENPHVLPSFFLHFGLTPSSTTNNNNNNKEDDLKKPTLRGLESRDPHGDNSNDQRQDSNGHRNYDQDGDDGTSKLVQVFTKQANMIDALLRSLIDAAYQEEDMDASETTANRGGLRTIGENSADFSDGVVNPLDPDDKRGGLYSDNDEQDADNDEGGLDGFPSSTPVLSSKLDKLCVATFNASGECVHAVGSLEEVLKTFRNDSNE